MRVYNGGMEKKDVYETLVNETGEKEIESVSEMIEMSGKLYW